jgi:hypothetical protein
MHKPKPNRKQQVVDKIAYATHRHQELMSELFSAKNEDRDPTYLVHAAADVLAAARECFDYLGQDIIECWIIPNTANPKLLKAYADGKLKSYFPFYTSQIAKADTVFIELSTIEVALYRALLDFAKSIEDGAMIPETLFSYKAISEMKDMVNEKKHNQLIAAVSDRDREYLVKSEGMTMILPITSQKGWSSFSVQPGTKVSKVAEYRFQSNQQEVGKFCLFAVKATERVISSFYANYFE